MSSPLHTIISSPLHDSIRPQILIEGLLFLKQSDDLSITRRGRKTTSK
jgi:hypothetical protein